MDKQSANRLITNTFDYPFDIGKYKLLSRNIFKEFEEAEFSREGTTYIPEAFRSHIKKYARLGTYEDTQGKAIEILIVYINEGIGLDRARTLQRNFISNYLDDLGKDAALVAFTTSDMEDWRFSLITIEYKTIQDESGKIKTKKVLSSAKRFSFLVGKNEANHTAQQQIIPLLTNSNTPSIEDLQQAFSVEQVTDEFYQDYKKRFLELGYELNRVIDKDEKIKRDFSQQNIDTDNFAKKLMGQIVFLYFVQKKGWLGVGKDVAGNFLKWGEGDKKFMRSLFEKKFCEYDNFFNDVLEPLFYEALATERANNYYSKFECKIPFLSGGLFEAINGYNWQETDITISNNVIEMILDTFDRYNFTVKEDDPLDKEVAIDPEMLGKVFENLLPENIKKGKGAFYTPRPIVHYMCQESLINYLDTHLDIDKNDITLLIKEGEAVVEHDKIANSKEVINKLKYQKRMPNSIIENATEIDNLLTYVKICDPAIGSGAFPMGLLHEIVVARNILTTYIGDEDWRTKYKLKSDCIQNSIYGVDIDEGAIEIAKLRLWLSLIVDEDDIEKIKPLPNLDYKIICGNSLISRYELDSPIDVVFSEFNKKVKSKDYRNQAIKNLVGNQEVDLKFYKKITNDFLSESSHSKKINFRELIDEIKNAFKTELDDKDRAKLSEARGALENLRRIDVFGEQLGTKAEISKAKKKLEKLKQQKQETQDGALYKNAVEWRFEFPNLLDSNGVFIGFDIVIANPPYLKERDNAHIFQPVNNSMFGTKWHQGKMDFWFYFLHRAIDICNYEGSIAFITSRYWLNSSGASKLIQRIKNELSFINVVDVGKLKVFDNVAGQHIIHIYSKVQRENFIYKKLSDDINHITSKVENESLSISTYNNSQVFNSNNEIIFSNDVLNSLKNVIELGKCFDVSQGVVEASDKISKKQLNKSQNITVNVGDGVFVLSQAEVDSLSLNSEEFKILEEYIDPNDVSRYEIVVKKKKYLIYSDNINKNKIDSNPQFSNIRRHLDSMSEFITSSNRPYGIHRARKKKFFTNPKICFMGMFKEPNFCLDTNGYYFGFSFSSIINKDNDRSLKYLLALLNSNFAYSWFKINGKQRGVGLDIGVIKLRMFPIPIIEKQKSRIEELVDTIITNKSDLKETKELEDHLDVLIYKLYELNYEDVLIIDEAFAMSEVEYNNFVL